MGNLINAQQVAEKLGVSPITVYKWASEGKIPFHKFGKCKRFKEEDVNDVINDSRVEKH